MANSWHVFVVVVVLLNAAAVAQKDSTQSGCDVCANTGDCSRAYRGSPGQFCGNWLDRQSDRRPCCCPDNSVCKVSNYACNCGYAPHYVADGGTGLLWLWWLLGSLGLLLCCCGCCFLAAKRIGARDKDTEVPVAAPVATPGGASSQPYTVPYASAPPGSGYAAPAYGQSRGGGRMSAGTGAALGGTAGLLGGLLLADTLGDRGDYGGGGGDFGGGSGFDGGGGGFAGDF